MRSLLNGCRALYTPAHVRSYPTPLIGDGPVLRFWREEGVNSDVTPTNPRISNVLGPTWDMAVNGGGVWAYVPDKWRGVDRSSGEYGRLWRANGTGASVMWHGVITGTSGIWRGLAGVMMDANDSTPWAALSLRLSNGNNITAQTSQNRTIYVEAMHASPYDGAGLQNIPLVCFAVLRKRPGANTRLELWINGVMQASTVDREDFYQHAQFFPNSSRGIVFIGSPSGVLNHYAWQSHHTRMFGLWDRDLSPREIASVSRSPLQLERTAFAMRSGGALATATGADRLRFADSLFARPTVAGATLRVGLD